MAPGITLFGIQSPPPSWASPHSSPPARGRSGVGRWGRRACEPPALPSALAEAQRAGWGGRPALLVYMTITDLSLPSTGSTAFSFQGRSQAEITVTSPGLSPFAPLYPPAWHSGPRPSSGQRGGWAWVVVALLDLGAGAGPGPTLRMLCCYCLLPGLPPSLSPARLSGRRDGSATVGSHSLSIYLELAHLLTRAQPRPQERPLPCFALAEASPARLPSGAEAHAVGAPTEALWKTDI